MEVYAAIEDPRIPLADVPAYAQRAERLGFTGLLVPEAVHDPFLLAMLALERTRTLKVATSVVLAFPRSPMHVAYSAWDLQGWSSGRFILGLGSQVKGNIVGRFSTKWQPPVPRMRDFIRSLRAIWRCWQHGGELSFTSEHYAFTRMQPFFNPGPIEHPEIPIFLGAVSPMMVRLAGEIADGLMTHPTNSDPRFLREVLRPELAHGAARGVRDPATVSVIASTFVATGPTRTAVAEERERMRQLYGFLYSTPQYWRTLELHGWRAIGEHLQRLARDKRWGDMPGAISDDIMRTLVPEGTYEDIAAIVRDRFDSIANAVTLRIPPEPEHDEGLRRVLAQLRA